jgi:hypothetical protein
MIESRRVLVSGAIAERSARLVGSDEPVLVSGPSRAVR